MDEGAPQAAAVRTPEEGALDALRLDWGGVYAIGRDGERDWWAARKGCAWAIVTAPSPDGLRAAMAEDHGPVTS